MKLTSFEAIVRALNEASVRYLVGGGIAVNAHGYLRYTKDVDLIIDLAPDNALRAVQALAALGFKPAIPVAAEQFADLDIRTTWIRDKNMEVMQFFSDLHSETPIDIFVSVPFDFDVEFNKAFVDEDAFGLPVRFVALDALIEMKAEAGRPRDLDDVEHLRWLREEARKDERS